jgi:hypothetical protein
LTTRGFVEYLECKVIKSVKGVDITLNDSQNDYALKTQFISDVSSFERFYGSNKDGMFLM